MQGFTASVEDAWFVLPTIWLPFFGSFDMLAPCCQTYPRATLARDLQPRHPSLPTRCEPARGEWCVLIVDAARSTVGLGF